MLTESTEVAVDLQSLFDADADFSDRTTTTTASSSSAPRVPAKPQLSSWQLQRADANSAAHDADDDDGERAGAYVGLLNQGATCYLNSLLQCMYLTPELRSAIYAIPPVHLESAANFNPTLTPAAAAVAAAPPSSAEPRAPSPLPTPPPPVAAAAPVRTKAPAAAKPKPDYDLDSFVAMGFELDMIQRVASLYPRDANACLECLLGGGVPESAVQDDDDDDLPPLTTDFALADYDDVGGNTGNNKRRRYDPTADQSLVTSRALVVVDQPPAAAPSATTASPAAPPRRSTAADVLFELQSLFATLQLSRSAAISTRALTDAFGWRSAQAVQQQDVHELNRMLFDVIERALKRTPQAKLVQQLYGGATTTALRCEVCGTERRRADALLDLPLSLRDAQTVHAALATACGSERLCDSNRLTCDVCNARQDTTRSVRLGRFASTPLSNPPAASAAASDDAADGAAAAAAAAPEAEPAPLPADAVVDVPPLLWLPLARFDYDLERGQRVKLTQPFLFPLELDVAPYVVGATSTANAALENYVATTPGKPTVLERLAYLTRRCEQPTPYRYVLAAVVLHSGGPFGGHYHALAREPTGEAANVWHDFNDSRITPLGRTEPLQCEAYFAWRAAQDTPEAPALDTLPDELRGTHRALQKLADAVEGTESAYMLLYRREPAAGAIGGGELSAPALAHADWPPATLAARLAAANAERERERVARAVQRNQMELDVCVPQWLRVLDDGSVVMADTNTAAIGEPLGEPLADDPAQHSIAHMLVRRLAVDGDGRTTRVRVSCDRRVTLALLGERLRAVLCAPPSSAETGAELMLAPLRFRGDAAVIAERPLIALTGAGAVAGATVLSAGIAGRSVRMLLWNGALLRDSLRYTGPAINAELLWFSEAAHTQVDLADGLPLRTTTSLVARETATLTSLLTAAVHRCESVVVADGDRFLLSVLTTQRATPLIEATLCARDVAGAVDGWCLLKPEVAASRTLLDTDVGDGAQLALERVAVGALPNRTTAADRFAVARRSKVRLFLVDGRDGRVDGGVHSIYCARTDPVIVAKRRAVEALLAADNGGAPASDERIMALMSRARLRRTGSAIGAVAMGDLAALMWLREEARPLTHYAVEDYTRLLLEDVTWLDDAQDGGAGAGMSELALVEATEAASADGTGSVSLALRIGPRLRERLAAQTPPLDGDALARERLVVPRNCEINVLMEKVARRFGNMPVKGQLTNPSGAIEEVWALHARTVSLFDKPDAPLLVDQGHTLRNYNLMNNDAIYVDVGAARTGVCLMSLSLWCAAWQLLAPEYIEKYEPLPPAEPAEPAAAEPTAELSEVEKQTAIDAELAKALAAESAFAGGAAESVKFADRPERRLVTPLQLVSNRYATGVDATTADHASVDALADVELPLDSTLDEVRSQVLALPDFRRIVDLVYDEAELAKYTLRLWLKSRLLRGRTPTLRSLRVRDTDSLTVQLVPIGAPDTLDTDSDLSDVESLDDKAPPKPEVHEAPTIFDMPTPPADAVAAAPPPPPPVRVLPNQTVAAKRYLPLLLIVYRRDALNNTYHRRPVEVTFRKKGVAALCDDVAEALQALEPGVKGEDLLLAKYLLHNSTFVPLTDADAAPVESDAKQLTKKPKASAAGRIDRIRAQPYHMRDGDVIVAYRRSEAARDDFVGGSRQLGRGHKRRAGGDLPIEVFSRERNRRDEGGALQFDIDFGDT